MHRGLQGGLQYGAVMYRGFQGGLQYGAVMYRGFQRGLQLCPNDAERQLIAVVFLPGQNF